MQRILFVAILLLSLMVCVTFWRCSGGLNDIKAGNAAAARGDYDKAIGLYTKAIESGKLSLIIAYNNRGNALGKKGDYDKAIADFTKAIEINPNDAEAYQFRGYCWKFIGNDDKANADYEKAKKLDPSIRCCH